jgi:hypothetical protein
MLEQYDKTMEVIFAYINLLASNLPVFIFFGLVYILLLEWKAVLKIVKERKELSDPKYCYQICLPIIRRIYYLVGGVALFLGGYVIISTIQRFEMELPMNSPVPYSEKGNFILTISGMAAVLIFQFAGLALMFSAGGRFLVNTAKIITLLTVGFIIVLLILAHAQLI